jgi:hypothetical protein
VEGTYLYVEEIHIVIADLIVNRDEVHERDVIPAIIQDEITLEEVASKKRGGSKSFHDEINSS